jgi:glycosyltransferase involved in cell wall biosynthesis
MKILLIHNYYRYRGGEDRYVEILAETLGNEGHQVIPFFYDSLHIDTLHFLQKCLIPFRLIHSPAVSKKLARLVEVEKPDLAVIHNLSPLLSLSLLKVLRDSKVPILKRLENYKFLCLNGLFLRNDFSVCERCKQGNFLPGILFRCYQKRFAASLGVAAAEFIHRRLNTVIKFTGLFLASSQFVKKKFVEAGFPGERIVVYPNFLDFEPLDSTVSPGYYAVFLGRLSKEKGLITLLEAFKGLPELPLKILGEGPMEAELVEFVRLHRLKNISFEGFIDGELKRERLKRALFLIFPSECYESFGYTIIESFACGVPVIASDSGGARELVQEGVTGYLFKTGDPRDLQEKIARLMADGQRLQDLKKNALACAKTSYTRESGYRNLLQLFRQLAPKG